VADGSLNDEPPLVRPDVNAPMARADSWRRSSEGVPIEGGGRPAGGGERWGPGGAPGGPPTPV